MPVAGISPLTKRFLWANAANHENKSSYGKEKQRSGRRRADMAADFGAGFLWRAAGKGIFARLYPKRINFRKRAEHSSSWARYCPNEVSSSRPAALLEWNAGLQKLTALDNTAQKYLFRLRAKESPPQSLPPYPPCACHSASA